MKQVLFVLLVLFGSIGMTFGQMTVSGKVTDNASEPLIGASVFVKGDEGSGTITDLNGDFELKVSADSKVLIFSYTGYNVKEVEIGSQKVFNVILSEGQILDEIVVTGTGVATSKKSLAFFRI